MIEPPEPNNPFITNENIKVTFYWCILFCLFAVVVTIKNLYTVRRKVLTTYHGAVLFDFNKWTLTLDKTFLRYV
ncbi:hypothetical protein DERP_009067 [Dermatophagoides pteronyssinus]|uniref:Uncharacterized protein n=1 Tax=Dermatophagoides pteronyssinus TaxID=6956 RepID=A0ABQ8JGV2_DERPT|nr:hypothetical protein DERP_009067 [Dermatophagoides pteronyssinus]